MSNFVPNGYTVAQTAPESSKYCYGVVSAEHSHGDVVYDSYLTATMSELTEGYYYLGADVTMQNGITVSGNVTLCLNGHKLSSLNGPVITVRENADFTLCDCAGNGAEHIYYKDGSGRFVFQDGSLDWLTNYTNSQSKGSVSGGTIAGNIALGRITSKGGGVSVISEGTFTMTGGNIIENVSYTGGGLYNERSVVIQGGKISGNHIEGNNPTDTSGQGTEIFQNTGTLDLQNATIGVSGAEVLYGLYLYAGATNIVGCNIDSNKIFVWSTVNIDSSYIRSEIVKKGGTIQIKGGYFAVAPNESYIEDGLTLIPIDENLGDPDYREGFRYAVYTLGTAAMELRPNDRIIYDGKPIAENEDFSIVGVPSGTLLSYSYSADGQTYSEGLPCNVGEYSLRGTAFDAEEKVYYPFEWENCISIAKADPSITALSGLTATYGDTLVDVELPLITDGSWAWEDETVSVGDVGENYFDAIFTPKDTKNYKKTTVSVLVKVQPATPNIDYPTNLRATYGDTLADVQLPPISGGHWEWNAGDTALVGNVGVQTFWLMFVPDDQVLYSRQRAFCDGGKSGAGVY